MRQSAINHCGSFMEKRTKHLYYVRMCVALHLRYDTHLLKIKQNNNFV